jgi:hypothetical protein
MVNFDCASAGAQLGAIFFSQKCNGLKTKYFIFIIKDKFFRLDEAFAETVKFVVQSAMR